MSMEAGWNDAVQSFKRLRGAGKATVLLCAAALVILVFALWGFGKAIFVPSAKTAEDASKVQASAQKYAAAFESYVKQIDGRSLFIVPAPPSTPAPIIEEEQADEGPKVDPKPTKYGGPGLIGMMSGSAWFEGGKRLTVGGPADGESKLVALKAPWAAVVEWKGVEFDVPLFTRDAVIIASSAASGRSTTSDKKDEPKPETKPESSSDKPAEKPGDKPADAKPTDAQAASGSQPIPPAPPPSGGAPSDKPQPTNEKPGDAKPADPKPDPPTPDPAKPAPAEPSPPPPATPAPPTEPKDTNS